VRLQAVLNRGRQRVRTRWRHRSVRRRRWPAAAAREKLVTS